MNGKKLKNIIKASVVCASLLLFILVYVLISQLVMMNVRNKEILRLRTEIAEYKTLIETTDDEIESWSYRWKIEEKARELGYRYDK